MKIVELANCIKLLAYKIINSKFADYYFAYFLEQFNGKQFCWYNKYFATPNDYLLDNISNEALTVAYQLNYIIQVYDLYYGGKKLHLQINKKTSL
jgi:hypothetical protein